MKKLNTRKVGRRECEVVKVHCRLDFYTQPKNNVNVNYIVTRWWNAHVCKKTNVKAAENCLRIFTDYDHSRVLTHAGPNRFALDTKLVLTAQKAPRIVVFSQKLQRKMKPRLVIIECAGYIFWQLFLR